MKLIDKVTRAALRNRQVVLTIVTCLVGYGAYALLVMPRQEFPEFMVRQGLVIGVFPGASSEEVEERLTSKVEDYLFSYDEVDRSRTYSISEEGLMYIFVEVRPEVPDSDVFWATLRHGLAELKSGLPPEVLALVANNRFGDAAAVMLVVHSPERSYRELEDYLDTIEDRLRAIPAVSTINHYGLQREEIGVYFDNETLALYGIKSATILAALQMESSVSYAGSLDDGRREMPIHLPGRYHTESDLARQIIYADPRGNVVRLGDVARVVREYQEPSSYVQIDGEPCVVITLEMMDGNNIVKFGQDVEGTLEELSSELPVDIQINTIADMPGAVEHAVGEFITEFVIAIVAVIGVTMILLPLRVAAIAALTIPISVLAALGLLNAVGIELHTVSLAALIVVLGMVVDNTVVIIDDHLERLDQGLDPWTAAWQSVSDLFVPVFSATLAIIAVFVPMTMYLTGMAGDFIQPFPATIVITLGVSLLVAVLVVPIMTYSMIRTGLRTAGKPDGGGRMLDRIQRGYDRAIEAAFRRRAVVLGGALATLALTAVLATRLTSQFGPKIDRDQFAIEVYLDKGSALAKTAEAVDSLQSRLLADPRVEHVTAFIGMASPRFHTLYAPQMPASNYAQLIVNTVSVNATDDILRESEGFTSPVPEAYYRWKQLEMSDAKAPIEVQLSGASIPELRRAAERVEATLRSQEGVTWIRRDYQEPLQGVRLVVNEDESNRLGLTKAMLSYTVAAGMEGLPLGKVWEGDHAIDIVLYQSPDPGSSLEELENLFVGSPFSAGAVRARQLATPVPDHSEGRIVRRNGVEMLTVMADVAASASTFRIFNRVRPELDALDLPAGVNITYGGEHDAEVRYYTPFFKSLLTSIAVIFFILLLQFRTVRLSLLVMSTIPLCVFGAVLGLLMMSYPFSMTAFVGLISLVGMVIRNGVIYVDYAEGLRTRSNIGLEAAAIAAGKRRMRPIFLTSMAAAVGVIPMIMSRSPLWGPLGTVVCFGLVFTMVLSLVVLPVLYAVAGMPSGERRGPLPVTAVATALIVLLAAPRGFVAAQQTLTVEQSRTLALENSVGMKNAVEATEAARHVRQQALTRWFPEVSAAGGALRADRPLVDLHTAGGDLPVYDGNPANLSGATEFAYLPTGSMGFLDKAWVGAVSLTQPVFAGGRILNGNRLASLGVDVQRTRTDLVRSELLVETERQYWKIVSLDEKLRTVLAYRRFLADLEAQVRQAHESGLILRSDLLKVRLRSSELASEERRLVSERRLELMGFCQDLGIPFDEGLTLVSAVDGTDLSASRTDHGAALAHLGEYRLLEASVRAAHLETALAVGKSLPTVAVGVSRFRMELDGGNATSNTVGFLSVQVPLSVWWRGGHEIAESRNRERIAENTRTDAEARLLLQMHHAWTDLEEARDQLALASDARDLATENLDVERSAYENGLTTVADLLEAEAALAQATDRLFEARTALRMKELEYLKATGQM